MHNIQPRAGDDIKDFTAIHMWYERLDERYNFSLGNNILPLLTTDILSKLVSLDPPFLRDYFGVYDEDIDISPIIGTVLTIISNK